MGSRQISFLCCASLGVVLVLGFFPRQLGARDKDAVQYGLGLIVNIPSAESDVLAVVEDVVQNGKIQGTKEYAKDEFVSGASAVRDSKAFPTWTEGGKVLYKQRTNVLDPRNFKDSSDVGTLAVRYVVIGQDEKHTVLRVDAVFVETFRRKSHPSNGSVETAEYKEIHDHLESMQMMKDEAAEAERQKQQAIQKKSQTIANSQAQVPIETAGPVNASPVKEVPAQPQQQEVLAQPTNAVTADSSSTEDLKKRLHDLQQQTERRVKASGAVLKSAPFRTATNLQTLGAGTEVLIVVSTTYWFGVETHQGQHGWVFRDDLEELP